MANIKINWAEAAKAAEEEQNLEFDKKTGSLINNLTQTLQDPLVTKALAMQVLDAWNYLSGLQAPHQLAIIAGSGAPAQQQQPQHALGPSHPGQPGGQPHSPEVERENAELKQLLQQVLQKAGVVDRRVLSLDVEHRYVVQAVDTSLENVRISSYDEGKRAGAASVPVAKPATPATPAGSIAVKDFEQELKSYTDAIEKIEDGSLAEIERNMAGQIKKDNKKAPAVKLAEKLIKLVGSKS